MNSAGSKPKASDSAYARQMKLVAQAERQGDDLATALRIAGLSYDDLIYERSCEKHWGGEKPAQLSDFKEEA